MKYEKQIDSVLDNKDKQQTYRREMGRYRRALKEEFYLEAMLIVYATLEDRLRSFLYYLAVFKTKESRSIDCKKTKSFIRQLVYDNDAEKRKSCKDIKNMKINMSDISEKIKLIRYILLWVNTVDNSTIDDEYQSILKFECESLDIGGLLDTFEKIDNWRGYRNEIIHGLMNKNMVALDEHIADKVEEGMEYVKFIAEEGRKLKSKNRIRKALNLK